MRIEKIHTDKNPSNMMTNVLSKETLELFSELAGLSSYKGSLGKSLSHDLEGEKKEFFFGPNLVSYLSMRYESLMTT